MSSYRFGHEIYLTDNEDSDGVRRDWRYADDDSPVDYNTPRTCKKCNMYPTKEGHDPCIANLPGVLNACCGHGVKKAYIAFEDGRVVRGYFEIET